MTHFLYGELLWTTMARRAKEARRTKGAIAYVTNEKLLTLKSGDLLIVDASNASIGAGQTTASALMQLHRQGVRLYCHPGLHAKFMLFDSVLVASSANMSNLSINHLLEAGVETDSPGSISAATSLLDRLVSTSERIDALFLKRIQLIPVKRSVGVVRSALRDFDAPRRPARTWLVGTHFIEPPTDPGEIEQIRRATEKAQERVSNPHSQTEWFEMNGNSRFWDKADEGDGLFLIERTSPEDGPNRVLGHTTILRVLERGSL